MTVFYMKCNDRLKWVVGSPNVKASRFKCFRKTWLFNKEIHELRPLLSQLRCHFDWNKKNLNTQTCKPFRLGVPLGEGPGDGVDGVSLPLFP